MSDSHQDNPENSDSNSDDSLYLSATEDCGDMAVSDTIRTDANGSVEKLVSFDVDRPLLENIELNLDYGEKVSLVFLLYENAHIALQDLSLVERGSSKKLLTQWAECDSNWKNKLTEGLCLLQNYNLLRTQLGITREQAYAQFLPNQTGIFNYINPVKKALYRVCEDLTNHKKRKFRNDLEQSLNTLNNYDKLPEYKLLFFELYFLYLESIHFISVTDLTKIVKIFKIVDFEQSYELLRQFSQEKETNYAIHDNAIIDNKAGNYGNVNNAGNYGNNNNKAVGSGRKMDRLNNDKFPGIRASISYDCEINDDVVGETDYSDYYQIDPELPGICLIINNEFFYTDRKLYTDEKYKDIVPFSNKLEKRDGTENDKDSIHSLFTAMNYHVLIEENKTDEDILSIVGDVVDSVTARHSSLFIFILSHGLEHQVFGANSIPVGIADIKSVLYRRNCENLRNKPKVLVIQACQGQKCQELTMDGCGGDLTVDGPSTIVKPLSSGAIPKTLDICELYATVQGYSAVRSTRHGSWLIQSLCQNIRERHKKSHFADICTYVVNDCSNKKWYNDQEVRVMVPTTYSTFSRKFRLPNIN